MVTHNASFNCIAGKMLVLPRGWKERDAFLRSIAEARPHARRARLVPGRRGALRALTEGRRELRGVGGGDGHLALDPRAPGSTPTTPTEPAFATEPFCSILSETQVGSADPVEFLDAAVRFATSGSGARCRRRWWCAPRRARLGHGAALERAIRALRYGSVCVNCGRGWPTARGPRPGAATPACRSPTCRAGAGSSTTRACWSTSRSSCCAARRTAPSSCPTSRATARRTCSARGWRRWRRTATGARCRGWWRRPARLNGPPVERAHFDRPLAIRAARRTAASSARRASSSVSVRRSGALEGFPSAPMATKVRKASQQSFRSPSAGPPPRPSPRSRASCRRRRSPAPARWRSG